MAYTLNGFAELILKRHYGGQIVGDEKITEGQVKKHILDARNYFVWLNLVQNMKEGEGEVDPAYLSTIYADVDWDADQAIAYMTLPNTPVSLPHDKGIFSIRPKKGKSQFNNGDFVRIIPRH